MLGLIYFLLRYAVVYKEFKLLPFRIVTGLLAWLLPKG